MKSLLIPAEDTDQFETTLTTASAFASRFQSRADAVALRFAQFQAVGAEPIVAVAFPPTSDTDPETARRARQRFDTFVRSRSLADTFGWRAGEPMDDAGLGALARVYDLTVIARPGAGPDATRMTTFEAALFDSGRPILIAPPRPVLSLGEHVVVSWNQSTEAAHTVASALPILNAATTVTILTVNTAVVAGPDASDLRGYLSLHGIEASVVSETDTGRGPGNTILDATKKLGGDLLVKSAYTHSRLRQMIFGGATSQILSSAEIPVFMAN
ncbi:MAG: universal stress protein [Pseudomonadota bacterium]